MKLSRCTNLLGVSIAAAIFTCVPVGAQSSKEGDITILDRSANRQVVQRVTWLTNALGDVTARTNKYTQLATGLNYQENGAWKESKAEIEILNDGTGAIGSQTGHKVSFKPNLDANGVLEITTPDGKVMRSQIFGLGYYDRVTKQSEIIAIMKDAEGELHGDNEVVYPDAFNGVDADVRFRYTRAGIEQDVILRSQPPKPQDFGLNITNTQLEVFTEFIVTNEPAITTARIPGTQMTDDKLKFGKMVLGRGRAFPVGEENSGRRSVPTGKMWIPVDDRRVLLEAVEYKAVKKELDALPELPRTAALTTKPKSFLASNGRKIPAKPTASATASKARFKKQARLAGDPPKQRDGFVLDYIALVSSATDLTFQSGQTYFIEDYLVLNGTTTLQGGAIIKFAAYGSIEVVGPVVCSTSVGNGVMFTSMNDDTWGDIVADSTGSPQNGDVHADMLTMNNGDFMPVVLKNLSFRWGSCGIKSYGGSEIHAWHCTFDQMHYQGISADILKLRNCWFNQVGNPDGDYAIEPYYSLDAQHVTVNKCLNIWGQMPDTVTLTNCLFTSSGNLNYAQNISQQAVAVVPEPTACLYDCSVSDWYLMLNNPNYWGYYGAYLMPDSPYRDVGTTQILPALLTDIRKMTTHYPFQGHTPAFSPVDTRLPDLGFHYPSGATGRWATDTDGDGMVDAFEDKNQNGVFDTGDVSNWQVADSDGNGIDDRDAYLAADSDGDGLPNSYELYSTLTNPEMARTGNVGSADGYRDWDGDGLTELEERSLGKHPRICNVAPPLFSPAGGSYVSVQNVVITCPTAGVTIRYTLDGSEPTTSSTTTASGSSVSITSSKTLKAKAWKAYWTTSDTESQGYVIEATPSNLAPTLTISPASGGTFLASDSIEILAEAADADGSVAKLQLFRGSYKVSEANTGLLRYTLASVPSGTHTFTAKAIYNLGAVTISTITMTINASGPVVSLVGTRPFFTSLPAHCWRLSRV